MAGPEAEGREGRVERGCACAGEAEADDLEVVGWVEGGLGEVAVVRGCDAEEPVEGVGCGGHGGLRREEARNGE